MRPQAPETVTPLRIPMPALLLAAAIAGRPALATAQFDSPAAVESSHLLERADRLVDEGDIGEALRILEEHLALHPDDVGARWRAARAAVARGIVALDRDEEHDWYRRAIVHSDSALAHRSEDPDALRWSVAAKGNLALEAGPKEASRLGSDVWDMTHRMLATDPDDALAHHALGTLHFRIMELSGFERFLGKVFVGGEALDKGNWEDALLHLERAVQLRPDDKLFRSRLAEVLNRRGRTHEALLHLDRASALPTRTAVDSVFQRRVDRLTARYLAPPGP